MKKQRLDASSLELADAIIARDEQRKQILAQFETALDKLKNKQDPLAHCVSRLENISRDAEIQMFYFGGFPRDLWLGQEPRDVDIVCNDIHEERFKEATRANFIRQNRFGGMKLDFQGIEVDAWAIANTQPFIDEGNLLTCPHLLPEITFLPVESIVLEVYAPNAERLYWEKGFFKACEEKVLELQNPRNTSPDLHLVRLAHLQKKLGWRIGDSLRRFVQYRLPRTTPARLAELHQSHYGTPINPKDLYSAIERLIKLK
ncbi:MAG: hypothetical protein KJ718_00705 [Nanoarchaeota archaeon]|nr:hypothetical protein [Nanoarchaeota archaeon]